MPTPRYFAKGTKPPGGYFPEGHDRLPWCECAYIWVARPLPTGKKFQVTCTDYLDYFARPYRNQGVLIATLNVFRNHTPGEIFHDIYGKVRAKYGLRPIFLLPPYVHFHYLKHLTRLWITEIIPGKSCTGYPYSIHWQGVALG